MFGDPLNEPMILLKDVVEIFNPQDFNHLARARDFQDRVYSLCTSQVRSAFINDDLVRNPIACNGFLKETPCCNEISTLREHKFQSLAVTINGSVQIGPFPFDLYIGLVDPPGAKRWVFAFLCLIRNLSGVANDPAVNVA